MVALRCYCLPKRKRSVPSNTKLYHKDRLKHCSESVGWPLASNITSVQNSLRDIDMTLKGLKSSKVSDKMRGHIWHASFVTNSQPKTRWSCFAISMSSNVKWYRVKWKAIYDLLYVFHTNFDTIYELQPVESYVTFIWPCHLRSRYLM